jgi:hypothetical protein
MAELGKSNFPLKIKVISSLSVEKLKSMKALSHAK